MTTNYYYAHNPLLKGGRDNSNFNKLKSGPPVSRSPAKKYPPNYVPMHKGGNVRRTGIYQVLAGEILIPKRFRRGLGHKRIVDLIAKHPKRSLLRAAKVGDTRGGRITRTGPKRLVKGDVVISRYQKKGLTFAQIVSLLRPTRQK